MKARSSERRSGVPGGIYQRDDARWRLDIRLQTEKQLTKSGKCGQFIAGQGNRRCMPNSGEKKKECAEAEIGWKFGQ